jgi:hypothetical protein
VSDTNVDPTDEVIEAAIKARDAKTDELFSETHLATPERRDMEVELGWTADSDSEKDFIQSFAPTPEPDTFDQAEEAWAKVAELGPDVKYLSRALHAGELDFLPVGERLEALSRIDVAETRALDGDHQGALEALGGDRDALGFLLTERLDQDDASDLAEFIGNAAIEFDRDLQTRAHAEVREVVDANPILQEGRGAQLLAQALSQVTLSPEPGTTKDLVQGVVRMAQEEARTDRLGAFYDAFEDAAHDEHVMGDAGTDIWDTRPEKPKVLVPDYAGAFANERDPYDLTGEDAKAALDAKQAVDDEWRAMQQRVADRHEEERIRELMRRPGR